MLNLAVPPTHDDVRVHLLVTDITNWAELTLISTGVYAASQNSPGIVHASLFILSSNEPGCLIFTILPSENSLVWRVLGFFLLQHFYISVLTYTLILCPKEA